MSFQTELQSRFPGIITGIPVSVEETKMSKVSKYVKTNCHYLPGCGHPAYDPGGILH